MIRTHCKMCLIITTEPLHNKDYLTESNNKGHA